MRTVMREAAKQEEMKRKLSERHEKADKLVEKWSKNKAVGKGIQENFDSAPENYRNLAFVLENTENMLQSMTETQISNAFQTTPENVLRVIRLGYPNSVRGELFLEWGMETVRDSIYYLSSVYAKAKRGSTIGQSYHESPAFRYASEQEVEVIGTGDDSTAQFTDTLAVAPLRPFSVQVFVDSRPVATDDGRGNLVGEELDDTSTNSVDYNTGAITVTFSEDIDTGLDISILYNSDFEVSTNYDEIGNMHLTLRDHQFRARPMPLYVSWSRMTEYLLGSTLGIDAEEALVSGASQELKKSLDFMAIRMAYNASRNNPVVTFDTTAATGESEIDRAQAFLRAIDQAGDVIYGQIQRGGVTKMVGGPGAVTYTKHHRRFDGSNRQPRVGAYREGSLDNIDLYKAPSAIVPDNEILAIWRNENEMNDAALMAGTFVPLYFSPNLEFKELYTERGIAHFGDIKVVNPKYLVRIRIDNLASNGAT